MTCGGFEQDTSADTRRHGGPDKALHIYPSEHLATWRAELGDRSALDADAPFGENISSRGITEHDVCIGDLWQLGTATVQVSQARQPCWKLNLRFESPTMARAVQDSGRTGWYVRVLEPGEVRPGDTLRCIERPHPQWSLREVHRVLYVDTNDTAALAVLAELPHLSASWQRLARKRLQKRTVEDWSARLQTPTD